MSNNLDIPELSPTQNNKAVTIVEMFEALDSAITAKLSVDATADVTVTAAQLRRNQILSISNAVNENRIVTLEPTVRLVLVLCETSVTQSFTLKTGSTSVIISFGSWALVYLDGTANGLVVLKSEAGGESSLPPGGSTGQILTKLSESDGDAGWLDIEEVTNPYDIGLFYPDVILDTAILMRHVAPREYSLPAGFSGSAGYVGTFPSATTVLSVQKNGVEIGTISISTVGVLTFIAANETIFMAGDRLEVVASAANSLGGLSLTFAGVR